MSEDKYYTPEIEEFCIGFEFYVDNNLYILTEEMFKFILNHLTKDKTTLKDGSGLFKIDPINIRAKYLDKDDIESFGFVGQPTNKTYYKRDGYRLVFWPNKPFWLTSIFRVYSSEDEQKIFDGIIKNKTELRKLLTQLEIL